MRLIDGLRARAGDDSGFTMLAVITVIFCVTLLAVAALSAAQSDLKPGAHDKSRKIAYAAAEAGVQNYIFHLGQDADYWAKCTNVSTPSAVSDPFNATAGETDNRNWMSVPGSQARYTIELLPVSGKSACSEADPAGTMIDTDTGTFKIRATGEDTQTDVRRSIIATFKRQSLLDYLYLTDKETRSPELYAIFAAGRETKETGGSRTIQQWAADACDKYYGDDPGLGGRYGQTPFDYSYRLADGTSWSGRYTIQCSELGFNAFDVLAGPIHTNDEFVINCNGATPPQLGDSTDDAVETSSLGQSAGATVDPTGGYRSGCGPPLVNFSTATSLIDAGTWRPRSAPVTLPPTNSGLLSDTDPAYQFKGKTKITMSATTMRVTGTRKADGSPALVDVDMAIPADGVVYVANNGSCPIYTPVATDDASTPSGCGNLELEGDYAANVTFTAENDILVKDDVTRTSSGSQFLLGLIAQNYVRVHHPVDGCDPSSPRTCNDLTRCETKAGSPRDVSIDAAIVSLTRSFIVDNWFCGAPLGTLHVTGAIAQKYRGYVTSRNSAYTLKEYIYDSKLKYRSPPHFLDPVNAQWRMRTFTEQVPAR